MKLEQYRLKEGLTYEELSKLLGIKRSTIYKICRAGCTKFSLFLAKKIVDKTEGEVSYEDLSNVSWKDHH